MGYFFFIKNLYKPKRGGITINEVAGITFNRGIRANDITSLGQWLRYALNRNYDPIIENYKDIKNKTTISTQDAFENAFLKFIYKYYNGWKILNKLK